ncbi:hypothetical protein Hanom_Chr10g00900311 [Helianthus anomalus]
MEVFVGFNSVSRRRLYLKTNKFQHYDLDSFRLRCENHYDMSTVWRRYRDTIMRKVKLLDLSFNPSVDDEVIRLPPILLTCDSLEVLRLYLFTSTLRLPTVTVFRTCLDEDEDVCISCLNHKTLRVHNRNIGTYTERLLDYSGLFTGHGSVRYWVTV